MRQEKDFFLCKVEEKENLSTVLPTNYSRDLIFSRDSLLAPKTRKKISHWFHANFSHYKLLIVVTTVSLQFIDLLYSFFSICDIIWNPKVIQTKKNK